MDDRKRIQHLLALTQPVTEEVTFLKDCRPGRMTRFPINPSHVVSENHTNQAQADSSSLNLLASASSRNTPAHHIRQTGRSHRKQSMSTTIKHSPSKQSRVLRTVYLPSEQADTLMRTVQMLKEQLTEHQKLSRERIEVCFVISLFFSHDIW